MKRTRTSTLAAALLLAAACASEEVVAILPGPTSGFCDGSGPAIITGDGITVSEQDGTTDDVCTGVIARRSFRFALCACEGYATSTRLTTDSFASSAGAYDPLAAGTAGSVGVNADLQIADALEVHGDLHAGAVGGQLNAAAVVDGDVLHQGGLSGSGSLTAGGDATIMGPVGLGGLSVAGTLTVPSAADLAGTPGASYGALVEQTLPLADPCACADGDLVDVTRFVNFHAAAGANDNAAIGLSPAALAGYSGATSLDLPCGRFYLDTIDGDGELTVRIHGRVALFVGGNVTFRQLTRFELDDGAELDLFVGGLVEATAELVFGSAARPSKARLYVGGSGTIDLTGSSLFAGNLYAPRARLATSGPIELFGSLFVQRLEQAAPVTIHFDEDVQAADVGCQGP